MQTNIVLIWEITEDFSFPFVQRTDWRVVSFLQQLQIDNFITEVIFVDLA